MIFDFQTILFFITLFLGLSWLIGKRILKKDSEFYEVCGAMFPILLIIFLFRSFAYEPFRIPSASMMPTLEKGDFILVNKFAYNIRMPLTGKTIFTNKEPKRGDVLVFDFPCDRVVYRNKQLKINGESIISSYDSVFKDPKQYGSHVYNETIDGIDHRLLLTPSRRGREGTYTVPEGTYFVMGDNRDNSTDSRFECPGFVPSDHVVGSATRIWFNWDFSTFPKWNRIGDKIK
jgi:signal peptidase I